MRRAEVLRKREKYEERHLGAYTRIYPSEDPELQVRGGVLGQHCLRCW